VSKGRKSAKITQREKDKISFFQTKNNTTLPLDYKLDIRVIILQKNFANHLRLCVRLFPFVCGFAVLCLLITLANSYICIVLDQVYANFPWSAADLAILFIFLGNTAGIINENFVWFATMRTKDFYGILHAKSLNLICAKSAKS
jgi:hypothetical protein